MDKVEPTLTGELTDEQLPLTGVILPKNTEYIARRGKNHRDSTFEGGGTCRYPFGSVGGSPYGDKRVLKGK